MLPRTLVSHHCKRDDAYEVGLADEDLSDGQLARGGLRWVLHLPRNLLGPGQVTAVVHAEVHL